MSVKAGSILNEPKLRVTVTTADGKTVEHKDLTYQAAVSHLTRGHLDIASRRGKGTRSVKLSLEEDHVPCEAFIYHGPGHQSKSRCVKFGLHETHEADYGLYGEVAEWRGPKAFTGAADEPPPFEDDEEVRP